MSAAAACPAVGVGVHDGAVGVGVGVAYWETAALSPDCVTPEMARPAPAVLNSIPVTSMPRMAKRDFMDWLLREGFAALAANSLLDRVQLKFRGLRPLVLQELNDVVELGHRTLIRSSAPIPY